MDARAKLDLAIEKLEAKAHDLASVLDDINSQHTRLVEARKVLDELDEIFGREADTQSPAPLVEAASDGPPPAVVAEPSAQGIPTDAAEATRPDPQRSGGSTSDGERSAAAVPFTAHRGPPLFDQVVVMHRMHPTWTASMIAKELGAKVQSVATYLTGARNNPPTPPHSMRPARKWKSEAEMQAHYAEVAKRLGKS